jgi:NADH-quinone oxidoreductase subunit N
MILQNAAPLLVLAISVAALLATITVRRSFLLATTVTSAGLLAALASIPTAMAASQPAPGLFIFNTESLGFIGLILAASLVILIIAYAYWQSATKIPLEEFCLLLLIATLGATALAATNNFIILFLGLETMTLAMIGMIAYPRYRGQAEEAGLKYLILSGMSSAFVLFGIGLIQLGCGSLDFSTALGAAGTPMMIAGLAMLGVGAGFKLSVVPFHFWVPDIYAGAPAPSGAYVAVIAKIAVLAVLIRIMALPGIALAPGVVNAMTMIAILSMLIGNLLALMQDNIKRVLGYSSIAHLGYLLVAILAAGAIARVAVVFYLVTYAITMAGAFGVVAILSNADSPRDADKITDFRGMFWTRPALAAVMTLMLLSLAGIPPAIGFIAKMYIMAAGIHTDLWILIATMVTSSVIGLFYYLNIIIVMSLRPETGKSARAISLPSRVTMALVSFMVVGFGVAPQPLIALLKSVFG